MLFDKNALLSSNQPLLASAASTDVFDFGAAADFGKGGAIPLLVQVTENFNNLTSLTVTIQGAAASSFASPVDLGSVTVPAAQLKAGYQLPIQAVPRGQVRYMRINYAVTGTAPTTGKVTAGVVAGIQDNG